ncbi:hypothetical protein BpHYR1_016671 [Brachionus plicatilis]|uniref:Uncharacterized protein n=1 Tax=Brachionus plicatilis TaxID=10195 RepID=A0A3M7QMH0_BRAPC|nr:hypothetical protein BpHYR1_016671 [Brachionus plicatilis]
MWNQNFARNYPDEVYSMGDGVRTSGQLYEADSNAEFQGQAYEASEVFLDYQGGLDAAAYGQSGAPVFSENPEPLYLSSGEFAASKANSSYLTWNNEVYLMNENCYLYNNSLISNSTGQAGYHQKAKRISFGNCAYNCGQCDEDKETGKFWMGAKNGAIKHPGRTVSFVMRIELSNKLRARFSLFVEFLDSSKQVCCRGPRALEFEPLVTHLASKFIKLQRSEILRLLSESYPKARKLRVLSIFVSEVWVPEKSRSPAPYEKRRKMTFSKARISLLFCEIQYKITKRTEKNTLARTGLVASKNVKNVLIWMKD